MNRNIALCTLPPNLPEVAGKWSDTWTYSIGARFKGFKYSESVKSKDLMMIYLVVLGGRSTCCIGR